MMEITRSKDGVSIKIETAAVPWGIKLGLGSVVLVGVLTPFIIGYLIDYSSPFAALFISAIFWAVAVFFLRLLVWNMYGAEFYEVTNSCFTYRYDYRFWKSKSYHVNFEKIEVITDTTSEGDKLCFELDKSTKIWSTVKLNKNSVDQITEALFMQGAQNNSVS